MLGIYLKLKFTFTVRMTKVCTVQSFYIWYIQSGSNQ